MNEFMISATQAFWWMLLVLCLIGLVLSVVLLVWAIAYVKHIEKRQKTK